MGACCTWSADPAPAPAVPGVYVHLPFCRSLCPYCDFTIALRDPRAYRPLTQALLREWAARAPAAPPPTVYLGGGTPTELPSELLGELLGELTAGGAAREVTVEANPESATAGKLAALRAAGATRLSLGVQSSVPRVLAVLGRNHGVSAARAAFVAAREAGFASVNVDLIFGVPGQTLAEWESTLDEVLGWGPDHLSAYALELDARVPLARAIAAGRLAACPEAEVEAQYAALCRRAGRAGLEHYEISNFCRPGHASRHNQGYWSRAPYVGLGPGAHSFDGARRSWNVRPHRRYVERIAAGESAAEGEERLTQSQHLLERVFLELRTAAGLELGSLPTAVREAAAGWAARQDPRHVALEGDRLRFSEAGFWYSHGLTAELAALLPADRDGGPRRPAPWRTHS